MIGLVTMATQVKTVEEVMVPYDSKTSFSSLLYRAGFPSVGEDCLVNRHVMCTGVIMSTSYYHLIK